jgi:hypothetical protein
MAKRGGKGGSSEDFNTGGSEGKLAKPIPGPFGLTHPETFVLLPQDRRNEAWKGLEGHDPTPYPERSIKQPTEAERAASVIARTYGLDNDIPTGNSGGTGRKGRTPKPKPDTNRTRGVEITQTMGLKPFAAAADKIHRLLTGRHRELAVTLTPRAKDDIANIKGVGTPRNVDIAPELKSTVNTLDKDGNVTDSRIETNPVAEFSDTPVTRLKPRVSGPEKEVGRIASDEGSRGNPLAEAPIAAASVDLAKDALAKAKVKLNMGHAYRFGGTIGKRVVSVDPNQAAKHYADAMPHLAEAHALLTHPTVLEATKGMALSSEPVSADHIEEMLGHAKRMRIQKPARPFNTVQIGKDAQKGKFRVGSKEFKELKEKQKAREAAGDSPAPGEKMELAETGTTRKPKQERERATPDASARGTGFKPEPKDPRKVSDSQEVELDRIPKARIPRPGENL